MCGSLTDDFTVSGTEFTSTTGYVNKFLNGRYRLNLNGTRKLVYGIDWEKNTEGGFNIIIPGFQVTTDAVVCGEFY